MQEDGLLLNRIILREPGRGRGRILLQEIIDRAPSLGSSPRLWLRVASHNDRAIHLYTAFGFVHEATLAAAGRLPNGQTVDLMIMARPLVPDIGRNDASSRHKPLSCYSSCRAEDEAGDKADWRRHPHSEGS